MHELKKSTHDMDDKIHWKIQIFKRNETGSLEMKNLICQIKNTVKSLSNRFSEEIDTGARRQIFGNISDRKNRKEKKLDKVKVVFGIY